MYISVGLVCFLTSKTSSFSKSYTVHVHTHINAFFLHWNNITYMLKSAKISYLYKHSKEQKIKHNLQHNQICRSQWNMLIFPITAEVGRRMSKMNQQKVACQSVNDTNDPKEESRFLFPRSLQEREEYLFQSVSSKGNKQTFSGAVFESQDKYGLLQSAQSVYGMEGNYFEAYQRLLMHRNSMIFSYICIT